MKKIILHFDMDAFFASVEQRNNKELRGKPIAVGHGMLTTCSYEARKFGVRSAMSFVEAKKLCPNLILVPVNMNSYKEVGSKIQNLIKSFTDKCEFTSIDEGYVDITEFIGKISIEQFIARFKNFIFKNINLTCSVGIGFNRISAKIASDLNKPNGYFIFRNNDDFLSFLYDKNISIIPGIGKKSIELLKYFGIITVQDLLKIEKDDLISKFGINRGEHLYNIIRGFDSNSISTDRKRQSIGHETTFNININDIPHLDNELKKLSIKLSKRLQHINLYAKTVTLKIRYSNFSTYTKAKTLDYATNSDKIIANEAIDIFHSLKDKQNVRLIGIHLTNFTSNSIIQMKLENF